MGCYAVLDGISSDYPPAAGRFHTCYSPVRRSPAGKASFTPDAPRLACVKPVASVHPEPGSNSSLLFIFYFFSSKKITDKPNLFVLFLSQRPLGLPDLQSNAGLLWNVTKGLSSTRPVGSVALVSCTTSSLQLFQCSLALPAVGKLCKGTNYFRNPQIFQHIFETF